MFCYTLMIIFATKPILVSTTAPYNPINGEAEHLSHSEIIITISRFSALFC